MGSSPGSPDQDQGQFSIPDRTKPSQQGNKETGGEENELGQSPDKGKGKAPDDGGDQEPEGDEKKPEDDVPLDPKRKNKVGVPAPGSKDPDTSKTKDKTMYNIVTPNPNLSEGITDIKTKEQSYHRKVGDGDVNASGRYDTHNPHYSAVQSHGQEPKENGKKKGRRPGKVEEMSTTSNPENKKDGKNNEGDYYALLSPATF